GLERRLGGRDAGDGDAERRAAHVVEAELVAEPHRGRVAAVLAADAHREPRARPPPALDAYAHELADALRVELRERVLAQDPGVQVRAEEATGVIARQAVGALR